ncbi:ligand-dependent nuclear receptor-interacting factor 1 isoform X1 [Psammomys obesus]|uniref:ligand-dependent nuclear receptor-interacting factor 1 isoform X1 n=2 Tax=Psammomys obesus TaxID=48139 RepID=UPI002452D49B|nr:ligand-dependent nuclear receptor-interacting factor 1 isoform X1 [Psammomys obesus]
MSRSLQNALLKTAEENSGSHCVSGCMYQVVPTIGADGKNLLHLLPIPKSSGNLNPLVQSQVISHALKGNAGKPVQVTFQSHISSSSTSASVQLPVFQPANTTKYVPTVDTSGKGRVTSLPPVSKVESHGAKIDGLTVHTFAIPPSTQNDSSYFMVNTPSLQVNVNSSILPSGHHSQIPAHAQVKSVPASSLPPSVQQKILGTATTSTSGTTSTSTTVQIPTITYVSPVNSVKNRVTKNYQNIYPKPVILNTSQIPPNVATETQLEGGQQSQAAPVKWIFQKNLHLPSLVPVKSSSNVSSKILNTFVGRKDLGYNTIDTPMLNTISSSGTPSISVPIKENALIMLKKKVYLLTKKGTRGLPSQNDQKNSVSSDTSLRKDSSQVVGSSLDTEIIKEVVNSVSGKTKSFQLETKSLSNSQTSSVANLRAEKNEKVEKPSFSVTNLHTMNQFTNCLKQINTGFTNPVFPAGFRTGHNAPRKGNVIQSIEKMCSSVDAATVTSQQCVFRDQESQTQYEMASILKKGTQERSNKKYSQESNIKASHLKNDAEFKKIFGLTKDLRVCLTRIPDHLGSRKGFDSFSSLEQSSSNKNAKFLIKKEERKQRFSKKRKAEAIKKMDYTKRRKTESASATGVNGADVASSQVLNSILPTSDVLQHNIVTSHSTTREDKRTEAEYCSHEKLEKGTLSSSISFEQSNYFSKTCTEDIFPMTPPELEETIRDEKIRRLKQILREKEAALEEIRKKMHQKK